MKLFALISSALALPLVGAYLVTPPGAVAPGTTSECSEWIEYSSSLTCAIIEELFGMTEAEFEAWNPIVTELGSGCTLIADLYYCVQIDYEVITVTVASTSTSTSTSTSVITTSTASTTIITTTTTSSGNGISTPTPYQTGMTTNCDEFYLVVSGDECDTIATDEDISLDDFYAWNPAVGDTCEYLDLGDYVCVGIINGTATTTTTTTTSGDGVTTPTPYQTGMASDCDLFHLVVSGDECSAIATAADISLDDFYAWNPAVGDSCAYLDLGDYVCIGIL